MAILTALMSWLVGGIGILTALCTFLLASVILLGVLILLLESIAAGSGGGGAHNATRSNTGARPSLTVADGDEDECQLLARHVNAAEWLQSNARSTTGKTRPIEDLLADTIRANGVLLFILQKKVSGNVEKLINYLEVLGDNVSVAGSEAERHPYSSLRYAVFGIDDTSVTDGSSVSPAMAVDLSLRQLGARRVLPLCIQHMGAAGTPQGSLSSPALLLEKFSEWLTQLSPEAIIPSAPASTAANEVTEPFIMSEELAKGVEECDVEPFEDIVKSELEPSDSTDRREPHTPEIPIPIGHDECPDLSDPVVQAKAELPSLIDSADQQSTGLSGGDQQETCQRSIAKPHCPAQPPSDIDETQETVEQLGEAAQQNSDQKSASLPAQPTLQDTCSSACTSSSSSKSSEDVAPPPAPAATPSSATAVVEDSKDGPRVSPDIGVVTERSPSPQALDSVLDDDWEFMEMPTNQAGSS